MPGLTLALHPRCTHAALLAPCWGEQGTEQHRRTAKGGKEDPTTTRTWRPFLARTMETADSKRHRRGLAAVPGHQGMRVAGCQTAGEQPPTASVGTAPGLRQGARGAPRNSASPSCPQHRQHKAPQLGARKEKGRERGGSRGKTKNLPLTTHPRLCSTSCSTPGTAEPSSSPSCRAYLTS